MFSVNTGIYVVIYLFNETSEVFAHCNMVPFYQGKKKASLCSFLNRYLDIGFIEVVSRDLHYCWGFSCQLL